MKSKCRNRPDMHEVYMNKYEIFELMRSLMKIRALSRHTPCVGYQKIVQKGDFELYDYNREFLAVDVYSIPSSDRGKYQIRLYISNVDDGDWGARSKPMSLDKANSGVERLKRDLFETMMKLPNEKELNDKLVSYGLYGSFEN